MTTSDATAVPTSANTVTSYPTYTPTNTWPPTVSKGVTPSPTFFPTYFTFDPTGAVEQAPDGTVGVGVVPQPTVKPTFVATDMDTVSGTEYDPGAPTKAPTEAIQATPEPTRSSGTTEAGIKGPKRRKSVGFQSNWGPAHPGSMIYDFTRNSIYLTGTKVAVNKFPETPDNFQRTSCFVGEMPIADIEEWRTVDDPIPPEAYGRGKRKVEDFIIPDSLREKEIMSCHMIYYDDYSKTDDLLYVGAAREVDATARKGNIDAFMNTMQRNRNNPNWEITQPPVKLVDPEPDTPLTPVQYPVAMATGGFKEEDVISVISVSSYEPLMTEEYIENGDANNKKNSKNSLLPPGLEGNGPNKYAVPKRGANYRMMYQSFTVRNNAVVFRSGKTFGGDKSNVHPTGILNLRPEDQNYVVGGHIQGKVPQGMKLSGPVKADGRTYHEEDMDGFIVQIFYPRGRLTMGNSHLRFSSVEENPNLDDFVHGICPGPVSEDGTIKDYYVVGSTFGTMPEGKKQSKLTTNILGGKNKIETDGNRINKLSAWVTKVNAEGNYPVWTTQLYAINNDFTLDGGMTEAFGCDVIDSSPDEMYVGGTVYAGGIMDSSQRSAGNDDVWVSKLSTEDGSLKWIKQIGSAGNDRIARTNGIETDINGHAIVYGETTGEMYRKRAGEDILRDDGSSTDLFVTTFDIMTGATESTVESDQAYTKERRGLYGGLGTFFAIVLLAGGYFVYKKFKPRKGRSRPTTPGGSNLNTAFQDEPDEGDEEGGYSDNSSPKFAPPKAAFQEAEVKIV